MYMAEFVTEFTRVSPPQADGRLDAPAFHRNQAPIWSVIDGFLRDRTGDVLELGSGTGQHAVTFARAVPAIVWWPSDYNDAHLRSIDAWRAHADLANVRAATRIDLAGADWTAGTGVPGLPDRFVAILCCNVVHIAPWRVAQGLFAGAAPRLAPGGRLFLYGPFKRDGRHTAASNVRFDASLRETNPEWGVRDTADIEGLAVGAKLALAEVVDMPANNMILAFERSP